MKTKTQTGFYSTNSPQLYNKYSNNFYRISTSIKLSPITNQFKLEPPATLHPKDENIKTPKITVFHPNKNNKKKKISCKTNSNFYLSNVNYLDSNNKRFSNFITNNSNSKSINTFKSFNTYKITNSHHAPNGGNNNMNTLNNNTLNTNSIVVHNNNGTRIFNGMQNSINANFINSINSILNSNTFNSIPVSSKPMLSSTLSPNPSPPFASTLPETIDHLPKINQNYNVVPASPKEKKNPTKLDKVGYLTETNNFLKAKHISPKKKDKDKKKKDKPTTAKTAKKNISYHKSNYNPTPLKDILNEPFNFYHPAKHSEIGFDIISGYGVNTYKGITRNYNEDRVSIIVNVKNNKKNKVDWPKISYFAIYDGHAGNHCSEFLKNNLHHFIFNTEEFPDEPIKAINKGFKECEENFIRNAQNKSAIIDYSGSCALIILIINNKCYCINLGDSRALYSEKNGFILRQISRDQKPNDPKEKKRIYKAGGSVFKTSLLGYGFSTWIKESDLPYRINPGKLSVNIYIIIQNFYIIFLIGCQSFWRH